MNRFILKHYLARQPFCARTLTTHQLRWIGRYRAVFFSQLNQGMIGWQVERARLGI
uniref:Uncharacterized protein n=1 Tax=Anguilla anguilla TaxID=7936 RepID=A0A0E9UZ52_ANGAN